MGINPNALIDKFKQALSEKWGYIYGASGETWTQAKQNAATREQTIKWGQKWVGRRVADCSGLFVWAFKQLGGSMYHGSNTMFKSWSTDSGELKSGVRSDGQVLKPGSAVYKWNSTDGYHHVGLYIGDGKVIEAKGTAYGVVQSEVSTWTHWSELKGVDYAGVPTPTPINPTKTGKCIVTAPSGSYVNIRKQKSTSSDKLGQLKIGTTVNVVEDDGKWSKVEYVVTGYMMSQYLKEDA